MSYKKPKRLKNFDFSVKGAHVALVDKAANGKEQFLAIKSFNDDMVEYLQSELDEAMKQKEEADKASKVLVEMPLIDILESYYYVGREAAVKLVNAIKRATPEQEQAITEQIRMDIVSMNSLGISGASNSGGSPASFLIAKSKEEANMTDQTDAPDTQVDVQELLKSVEAQNQVIKALQEQVDAAQAAELARENARYVEITKKYESLGLEEADAPVIQALAKISGSEKVLKALDTALDLVNNADKIAAAGQGGSSDNTSTKTELELKAKEIAATEGITLAQATVKAIDRFPHLVK